MNIIYIRAAIEAATGVFLSLEEVRQLLIEEELVTKSKARNMIFPGYSSFYEGVKAEPKIETVIPVDRVIHD